MEYKYKIGDKVYYQKPLVLGQIKQIETFLKDFIVPGDFNISTLMSILGDKIPYALAIVLIEEGKSLPDKFRLSEIQNPKSKIDGVCNSPLGRGAGVGCFGYEPLPEIMNIIALEIAINIDLETTAQVIEDFFACNPIASIFQRLSGIISALGISPSLVTRHPSPETGLTNFASSSPEGTSPDETTSSGDTPLQNVNRISNIVSVT